MAYEKKDKVQEVAQELSAKFIDALKEGKLPWDKGFDAIRAIPRNALSNTEYQGVNFVTLTLAMMEHGFKDPRFVTFNQSHDLGGDLTGQKGFPIIRYQEKERVKRDDKTGEVVIDPETGKPKTEKYYLPLKFTVFNVEQSKGINLDPLPQEVHHDWKPIDRVEALVKESNADITHNRLAESGSYSPSADRIEMPEKDQFRDADKYYSTLLHELSHWTGHESRLNRELKNSFGTPEYAKEELRAEIGSCILCMMLGMPHEITDNKAYINSWIKTLENNPKEIISASKDATKIADYVLQYDKYQEKTAEETKTPAVTLENTQTVSTPENEKSAEAIIHEAEAAEKASITPDKTISSLEELEKSFINYSKDNEPDIDFKGLKDEITSSNESISDKDLIEELAFRVFADTLTYRAEEGQNSLEMDYGNLEKVAHAWVSGDISSREEAQAMMTDLDLETHYAKGKEQGFYQNLDLDTFKKIAYQVEFPDTPPRDVEDGWTGEQLIDAIANNPQTRDMALNGDVPVMVYLNWSESGDITKEFAKTNRFMPLNEASKYLQEKDEKYQDSGYYKTNLSLVKFNKNSIGKVETDIYANHRYDIGTVNGNSLVQDINLSLQNEVSTSPEDKEKITYWKDVILPEWKKYEDLPTKTDTQLNKSLETSNPTSEAYKEMGSNDELSKINDKLKQVTKNHNHYINDDMNRLDSTFTGKDDVDCYKDPFIEARDNYLDPENFCHLKSIHIFDKNGNDINSKNYITKNLLDDLTNNEGFFSGKIAFNVAFEGRDINIIFKPVLKNKADGPVFEFDDTKSSRVAVKAMLDKQANPLKTYINDLKLREAKLPFLLPQDFQKKMWKNIYYKNDIQPLETSVISDAAEKDKLEGLKFDQEKLASQLKEVKESFKAHSEDIDKKFNDVLRKATALSLADEKGPGGLDPDKMIIEALKIRQKALKELHDEYLKETSRILDKNKNIGVEITNLNNDVAKKHQEKTSLNNDVAKKHQEKTSAKKAKEIER